jgi:hypothetical protein
VIEEGRLALTTIRRPAIYRPSAFLYGMITTLEWAVDAPPLVVLLVICYGSLPMNKKDS